MALFDITAAVKLLVKTLQDQMGYGMIPTVLSSGTSAIPQSAGSFYYCLKAVGGNVTITSITDKNGNAVATLAGVVIQQGDEFKFPFKSVTITGIAVLYQCTEPDLITNQ